MRLLLGNLLFWVACGLGCGGCTPQASNDLRLGREVREQLAGAFAGEAIAGIPESFEVFTSMQQWSRFCDLHGIEPVQVDFLTRNLLVAFGGRKPSSGFSVEIESVVHSPRRALLTVQLRGGQPRTEDGTLTVLTYPWDAATIEKGPTWSAVSVRRR
ncbi:MAG: protease complex subunit PrcB family protein [Opitutaceae bacterium]|nr:protease complex subunit PrcB family protein [Opitutaceae bacterium]